MYAHVPQSDTASQRARILLATHPNILRLITGVGLLLVALSGWFVYQVLSALPDRDRIRALDETAEGTTVYDAHDRPVFALPTRRRIEVPLDRISQNLQNAIIAVEDVRFYEHDGIDGIRLIGAVIADLRERRAAEGASTITQQLARLSFLTRDKTLRRKVREAILAQQIERLYSKHDILEIYLNKVYFGDGLYGAEAASEGYFGKNAEQLTVAEGALLAGLVRAPSSTNPVANPQRAIERRNLVLKLMREHEFIDAAAYDAAILERVALKDTLRRDDAAGSHYKEVVRRQLLDQFGKDAVYGGRLQVYTASFPNWSRSWRRTTSL